ncbi:uncharacterized protein DUF3570 [Nitrosomonas sp. Nm84]|uniref:DUF3570 domain-containing protein n=1 Tax=Nitrosomonas sp. Nm84 TaxID=200124 RepID=UPI000D76B87C|nr:DUF3570 domain-containing protein [Nitrosomonas sp. Nm84]PXW84932.1 uncharacterized protein DUF3570 [Nitrosomonas sp. Nm84]
MPQRQGGNQQLNDPEISSVKSRNTLHALTSAALVLPGLLVTPGHAAGTDRINFQYSRYQEGERNLFGAPNNLKPISADVLHGSGIFSLTDRTKFTFGYTQDTWSGATPVTTTPLATTGGNRPYFNNGVMVGASPLLQSDVLLDRDLNPIGRDPITKQLVGGVDPRSVLVMSSASPETRRQATFGLSHEWNEAAISVAGGFSRERDYKSSFGNIGGRLDFNQKLTSVKFNGGYTRSDIGAILDHDSSPYITKTAYLSQIASRGGSEILQGNRQDWVANVGVSQVLTKNALVDVNIGYTHSNGFMENPYKAMSVIFIDPDSLNGQSNLITGKVRALIEQRPDIRNQVALNTKYIQYINTFNAAMHLGYRLSVDDWGVNTHTFDASWVQPLGSGWTLTPRIRYYSQDAASFYRPYLFSQQAFNRQEVDGSGRKIWIDQNDLTKQYFGDDRFNLVDQNGSPVDGFSVNAAAKMVSFDAGKLPGNFSSDHRLAGFGALSGGVVLNKMLGKGVALEAGFEYYTRASSMQIGSGNNSFADFDYYVANAAIKFDIEPTTSLQMGGSSGSSGSHVHASSHHHHKIPPAGIMFGHMLDKPGDFMAGYRFMLGKSAGSMMHGAHQVSDQTIVDQGCSDTIPCRFTPTYMNMHMHMLDIMYAPTKWLNVMLMPTFMDMDMNLRRLDGAPPAASGVHEHTGVAGHETGAVGDTYFSSLIKLIDIPGHRVHVNLGLSAPTGKVDIKLRRMAQEDGGLIHFGMQLGSGTWDFMPSLTYAGEYNRWSWGAQFSGVKRLEEKNKSGYRLGDMFQATTWGGFDLTQWLTASVRGAYTLHGAVHRDFDAFNARIGPMDFPANYGGQFWDLGLGVNAVIPKGRFAGNRFGFEWIQPVRNDFNGFQLDRKGSLAATWSYQF